MPSRPPLLSELTPSTSGIIQDPQTGDRRVAPSKRADGTLRKEIKIRPGYTPQEDVSKFRSARQQESDSRRLPKGSVIGLVRREPVGGTEAAMKGMTEAQRKNAKRKEKRKAAATKRDDEVDAPDDWDRSSSESHPNELSAPIKPSLSPKPTSLHVPPTCATSKTTSEPRESPNPAKALFKSAIKSSSSNPQTPAVQHLVPPSPPTLSLSPTSNTLKKESGGKGGGVKLFASALQSIDSASQASDPELIEKRARALRKKLIQAEQLKARNDHGESLLPEQLDKISKIEELQAELATMNLND